MWWAILFYIVVGIASRKIAAAIWHRKEDEKMREIIGRYTPSLIHASLSVFWDFVPVSLGGGDDAHNLYGNSGGYFIGDMLVDQDPAYYLHHLAPLVWGEALVRSGASLHHSVRCIRIVEAGNVFAHTAALLTGRSGRTFHWINTVSFWLSRPLSMPDGFFAWSVDVPPEEQYSPYGLIVLAMFVVTFYINGKWMIKMCMPREKDKKKAELQAENDAKLTNRKANGKSKGKQGKTKTHTYIG